MFAETKWIAANEPFEVSLTGDGSREVAIMLDKLDISSLFEHRSATTLRYHGRGPALPSGQRTMTVYDVGADGGKSKGANPQVTGPRLYNLKDDIGERTDLAGKMPARVQELQAVWDRWNAELVPPLWGGGKQ